MQLNRANKFHQMKQNLLLLAFPSFCFLVQQDWSNLEFQVSNSIKDCFWVQVIGR